MFILNSLSSGLQNHYQNCESQDNEKKDDDKNNWKNVRRSKTMKRQKPTNSSPAQFYLMFYISYFHHHNQLLDHHSAGHCLHNFENVSEHWEHYVSLFRVECQTLQTGRNNIRAKIDDTCSSVPKPAQCLKFNFIYYFSYVLSAMCRL